MFNEGDKKATHVVANIYRGPREPAKHNRGIRAVEYGFGELDLSFDGLTRLYLEKALMEGRTEVVGLDIGSGQGGLMRSFLENPTLGEGTRDLLRYHPELRLKLIGFTDAPSVDMHLKELPLNANPDLVDNQNGQISAANYAYTLTRWQTLKSFMDDKGIEGLDFILATKSLGFVSPVIFEETLHTGVDALVPPGQGFDEKFQGGMFIAYYFGGHLPWSWGSRNNGFRTNAGPMNLFKRHWTLVRRNNLPVIDAAPESRFHYVSADTGEVVYGSMVDQYVAVLNAYIDTPLAHEVNKKDRILSKDPDEHRRLVERAWGFYKRLGVLSDQDIQLAQEKISSQLPAEHGSIARFDLLAKRTLALAFRKYEVLKRRANLQEKRGIVEGIPGVDLRWTHKEEPNGGGFVLTKI